MATKREGKIMCFTIEQELNALCDSGRRPNFLPPSDFSLSAAQLQHIARHTSEKVKSLDAILLRPIDRRIEKYPLVRTLSPGNAEPV